MTRWLVTGAVGQLATACEPLLAGEVFLMREQAVDLRDEAGVRTVVRGFAPNVILHTAAFTAVDDAEAHAETAMAVNEGGTRNLLAAVRGTHTLVVYISSDYVFDGAKGRPYVESDEPHPLSAYGRSKLAGERLVLQWPHGIVVRTAWLYSATGNNFVKTILRAAQQRAQDGSGKPGEALPTGEPLRVVSDQVGSPTYAPHLAAGIVELLRRGLPAGIYHLAGSGFCSWYELAQEVVRRAGLRVPVEPITTAQLGRPAPRPAFSALASERRAPQLPPWFQGVAEAVAALTQSTATPGKDAPAHTAPAQSSPLFDPKED
jgi:dTDP-4-dehydrorhamnose reductase